ncbi:MAG TPA: sigma-70 family RNA polymerase sigma factor [Acidimicrobiales bacterium]|nr:sigma-70 family RNA polymerase sigma factor [Acidimicrobiales bacterium]
MRLRSARADDFEALFRKEFASLVQALTVVAGDRDAAADAVQEAFLQAYRHWGKVAALESPAGWVRHAAINRIKNQHRGRARLQAALPRLVPPPPTSPTSDERLDVGPMVAELPEQQRAVVALYYLLDQPVGEVARFLGVEESTVRSLLRHGRARLSSMDPREEIEA